jgi:hypothetical protein
MAVKSQGMTKRIASTAVTPMVNKMFDKSRVMRMLSFLFLLGLKESLAFVSSSSSSRQRVFLQPCRLRALPSELLSFGLTQESALQSTESTLFDFQPNSLLLSLDLVELSKTVGLTILGVFLFFTIFTFITVNVLMPAAAKQVEDITKQVDPALWDEYMRKLGPGESMATRPDLVQELGQKVLKLQNQQFQEQSERAQASQREPDVLVDPKPHSEPPSTTSSTPLDVEIVDKNQWDD